MKLCISHKWSNFLFDLISIHRVYIVQYEFKFWACSLSSLIFDTVCFRIINLFVTADYVHLIMRDYLQEPIIEELIEENLFHMLDEETDTEYVFRHSYMVF